jgi:hypothetical protein
MTHDDSVHIAATSPARRCTLARPRRGDRASGRQTIGDVVVSGHRRAPIARRCGSAMRPHAKFSASQSLKNSRNGERISIVREPGSERPAERPHADAEGAARGRRPVAIRAFSTRLERRPGSSAGSVAIADPGSGAASAGQRGKFSASQSLENTQNGERISILREPVPGGSAWLTLGQRGAAVPSVNTGRSSLRATAKQSRLSRRCVAQVWIASLC